VFMEKINFYKMSGCGNDFIIIDNRKSVVAGDNLPEFAKKICCRRMSVGADGLVLIENTHEADFKWQFYNSDGSLAEMCGNAARCTARFAYINKIAGSRMSFKTQAGIISAQIMDETVRVKMTDPENVRDEDKIEIDNKSISFISLNTGVPHVVIKTDDIESVDVINLGKKIRFHDKFAPAGTNVNFISRGTDNRSTDNNIIIRTYERGVENETLACGTGCVASALAAAKEYNIPSPINCLTRSGNHLTVHYSLDYFKDVFLEGDARIIYKGELNKDAWNW